ncbi:MAG: tRNA (adenosine(37)-N6)-dimethylallyltransferase MiaA [Myxococcota bacterium]
MITGPTASGKTELAIALAERFDGEIVNADSMQVFRHGHRDGEAHGRGAPPGAAPPLRRRESRRALQRGTLCAGGSRRRRRDPRARPRRVPDRGTGLYIRAFLDGLVETGRADPHHSRTSGARAVRAEGEGDPTRLHRRLAEFDPEAADKIHPNDVRRVVRALEILEQSGQRASSVRDAHGFRDRPFRVLHLCIDPGREVLHERIARRSKAMIDGGLLREVRQLRELGYGPKLRPMQAIGYRHIQPVVDGADTLVNALAALETDTRRFARRQRTWIRAVPDVEWFDPADADAIFARVERFLAGDETGAREQGVQTATAEAERGPSRRDARGTRSRAAESAG